MCVNISSIKRIFSNQSHYFPDIPCMAYYGQWWNDRPRKTSVLGELSHCHSVLHKTHKDWLGREHEDPLFGNKQCIKWSKTGWGGLFHKARKQSPQWQSLTELPVICTTEEQWGKPTQLPCSLIPFHRYQPRKVGTTKVIRDERSKPRTQSFTNLGSVIHTQKQIFPRFYVL